MTRAVAFLLLLALALDAQPRKKVLAIGAVAGYQHDKTTDGLATIWKLGKETGVWDTFIRTNTQLITKKRAAAERQESGFLRCGRVLHDRRASDG